jgi:hypothetical protein
MQNFNVEFINLIRAACRLSPPPLRPGVLGLMVAASNVVVGAGDCAAKLKAVNSVVRSARFMMSPV